MKRLFEKNLEKIMPSDRAMILAYDHGFEHGPRDFKDNINSADPLSIIRLAEHGGFTGLVVHGGIAAKYHEIIIDSGVPLILKLNGRSEIYTEDDLHSPLLYGKNAEEAVAYAVRLGAKAVGFTVYTGSKHENQMNQEFSQIAIKAHSAGLAVIAWMYPRGKCLGGGSSKTTALALRESSAGPLDETSIMVAYAARIGMELGADIVKVKYTGSVQSFRWVIENCKPTKVVMSGGLKTATDAVFLDRVKDVLSAGCAGVAVGRNVWQRMYIDSVDFSVALRAKIFK